MSPGDVGTALTWAIPFSSGVALPADVGNPR